jgi:predicted  nucleic acid-binding Zn-ribbon protein
MKKIGFIIMATAFICGSGFFKKSEDGSYSVDTSAVEKQAADAAASASAQADKLTAKASDMATGATEQIKEAAAKYKVSKEEIMADLSKPLDQIKTKLASMDAIKLTSYLSEYSSVLSDTKQKVADYTQQVKDLKWTQKWSAKAKELKTQVSQYNNQYTGLKEQCSLYVDKLKAFGFDPSSLGIDLSAYGL